MERIDVNTIPNASEAQQTAKRIKKRCNFLKAMLINKVQENSCSIFKTEHLQILNDLPISAIDKLIMKGIKKDETGSNVEIITFEETPICYSKIWKQFRKFNASFTILDLLLYANQASFLSNTFLTEVSQSIILRCSQITPRICFRMCQSQIKRTKIIIIGAGIAGLSAAYTLQQSGINDFKVLEAQPQPGGRINSLKFKSGYIELGAQWLHGSKSRLYEFIIKKDLLSSQVSYEGRGQYLRKGGERVNIELVCEIKEVVLNILNKCEEFYNKPGEHSNISVGEFLKREFENYLLSCHLDSPLLTKIKRELFDWHLRFQIIDNSCHSLEDLSAVAWGRYHSCGDENLNLKIKYSQVVNVILKELLEDSIICNKPVKLIEWDGKQIKCYTPNELYLADHIIITSSVGFIKEKHGNLFQPSLPNKYLEGFECFGFGTINKIFLYYKDSWWHDMEGIQLVWDSTKESLLNDQEDLLWIRGVTGFDVLTQLPTVLLCWVGGKGAELMESLSDEEITNHCTILLNIFTGKQVPKPNDIVRSRWYSNEYTRGSYSYYNMANTNTELTLIDELLQPIISIKNELQIPTIYFAGEALSKHHFSTVHGAFSSGLKQAKKLIEFLQQ